MHMHRFDKWPLYVAEMDYYMGPSSVTSKKCLDWRDRDGTRDPQCLPLGGQSVWATDGTLDTRPKVLATAGMDTASIFHDLSTGANDAVSVIATLLAAADAISQVDTSSLPQQIAFLLAQADEWGYAGTRRFVRDLGSFQCSNPVDASVSDSGLPQCLDPVYPTTLFASLGMENITAVIGVDQVGVANRDGADDDSPFKFFVHGLEGSQATVSDVVAAGTGADKAQVAKSSQFALPPTGAGVFVQAKPALPVAVLAGYDAAFIDPRYHSEGDATISVDAVTAAANVLARSLYKLAGGASADDVPAVNSTLVSALVGCLTSSWDCDFMSGYYRSEQANLANYLDTSWISLRGSTTPPNYYVGVIYATQNRLPVVQHAASVYTRYSGTFDPSTDVVYVIPSKLEAFARSYLMFTLGSERNSTAGCASSADCGVCSILHYDQVRMECQQGQCICPNAFYHLAMDPGIEPRSRPNTFKIVDESAPSYTEPYWSNLRTRVYLDAGSGIGYVMFSIGMIVLVGSIVCSWMFVQSLEKKKVL
jgi:nicastrin